MWYGGNENPARGGVASSGVIRAVAGRILPETQTIGKRKPQGSGGSRFACGLGDPRWSFRALNGR